MHSSTVFVFHASNDTMSWNDSETCQAKWTAPLVSRIGRPTTGELNDFQRTWRSTSASLAGLRWPSTSSQSCEQSWRTLRDQSSGTSSMSDLSASTQPSIITHNYHELSAASNQLYQRSTKPTW